MISSIFVTAKYLIMRLKITTYPHIIKRLDLVLKFIF